VPCPPIQEGVELCCTPKPEHSAKDWVGSPRTSLLAWWLPSAAIVAGLFAPIPARTAIWSLALAWMGLACVLNARQCSRTHCRYTGPYYLAMIIPVVVVGMGLPLGPYSWVLLGLLILGGCHMVGDRARMGEIFHAQYMIALGQGGARATQTGRQGGVGFGRRPFAVSFASGRL
jgi:hypothetical protein